MLAVALVIFLNMTSCSTYDEGPAFSLRTKKARLTNGEWEVVKIAKESLDDGSIVMEFEKDGDFEITVEYSYYGYYSFDYTATGEWEWEDGKEVIEIDMDGSQMEWKIKKLTNDELWFEDEDDDLWECEKK